MARVTVETEKRVTLSLSEQEASHLVAILNQSGNIQYAAGVDRSAVERTSAYLWHALSDVGIKRPR